MVIFIDSILKKEEIYYPPVFLKECKYIEKQKKKMIRHITWRLRNSSDDSDESDEE